MARFQFMFTVLCPICNEHFEISHWDIEVICNGQVWTCTWCKGEIDLCLSEHKKERTGEEDDFNDII